MADDSQFITKLIGLGLSEKEAQLYLHLLKYGVKPAAVVARHMGTYREDVYRTLNSLIDKGMVAESLSAPTVYAALPLETVLDVTLTQHKLERQQIEKRKWELEELFDAMDSSPPVEWCSYRVLCGPKEMQAFSIPNLLDTNYNMSAFLWGSVLTLFYVSGTLDVAADVVRRGARTRLLTDISHANLEAARYALASGAELRHIEQPEGVRFSVRDGKVSVVFCQIRSYPLSAARHVRCSVCM
jgi:hypothetical protein